MKTRDMRARVIAVGLATFSAVAVVATARGDGGIVRAQAGEGPYVATLFSPADLSRDRATELSVLMQDQRTGAVVLAAEVDLRFAPPPGARLPLNDPWCRPPRSILLAASDGSLDKLPAVLLTQSQSDNKLLYGASIVFPVEGDWRAQLTARIGDQVITREIVLPVGAPASRLAAVWLWLVLPPGLLALFAVNQRLKLRPG